MNTSAQTKSTITPQILSVISRRIAQGQTCLALALTNEYLSSESPLHRALVLKCRRSTPNRAHSQVIECLEQGKRWTEIKQDYPEAQFESSSPTLRTYTIPEQFKQISQRQVLRRPSRARVQFSRTSKVAENIRLLSCI